MARPLKEINQKQFEKLCGIQCTEQEICYFFEVCEDTLNSWCKRTYTNEEGKPMTFAEIYKTKREIGKMSLRRKQWALADKSAAMAIFLGKNYLGQSDKVEMNVETNKGDVADVLDRHFKNRKSNNNSGSVKE